ncbi:hypothetical protein ABKV19_004240, partial [Rosa sericea]
MALREFSIPQSQSYKLDKLAFLVTFCSLHVPLRMRFFEQKPLDQKIVMRCGIMNGISIGLLDLSLGFNSIDFYQ